jgi:hypothetical protein
LNDRHIADVGGNHQRCNAIVVGSVDVLAKVNQQFYDFEPLRPRKALL